MLCTGISSLNTHFQYSLLDLNFAYIYLVPTYSKLFHGSTSSLLKKGGKNSALYCIVSINICLLCNDCQCQATLSLSFVFKLKIIIF